MSRFILILSLHYSQLSGILNSCTSCCSGSTFRVRVGFFLRGLEAKIGKTKPRKLTAIVGTKINERKVATIVLTPEQIARRQIDRLLKAAGWALQNPEEFNRNAALGVAVR